VNITPEVVQALRYLRNPNTLYPSKMVDALNVLDNAGIFAAIDEATGYDIDPEPERVSKCTCPPEMADHLFVKHLTGCPGDPAEWGDSAFRDAMSEQNRRDAARSADGGKLT
jgi:hypothetical protein